MLWRWFLLLVLLAAAAATTTVLSKQLAGGLHSFHAIQPDGQVFALGKNTHGQLGDNSTVNRASPVPMLFSSSSVVVDVASMYEFVCVVDSDGQAHCAGQNAKGQLGDGTTRDRLVAVPVVVGGDVSRVFTGKQHACALLNSGGLQCWGDGSLGALGTGSNLTTHTRPMGVLGFEQSGVARAALGVAHTCVLTTWGAVECTGSNKYRSLGDGSSARNKLTMQPVVGLDSGVVSLAAGDAHTCAVDVKGALWCWGWGAFGQLGQGRNANSAIPIQPIGLAQGVASVFCGPETTQVVYSSGSTSTSNVTASVFGRNDFGQFGTRAQLQFNTPVPLLSSSSSSSSSVIREIRSSPRSICVLLAADNVVQCRGSDAYGQLGGSGDSLVPVKVFEDRNSGVTTTAAPSRRPTAVAPPKPQQTGKLLAAGYTHFCSLQWDSNVYCFGSNAFGELGVSPAAGASVSSPVQMVVRTGSRPVDVAAGEHFTCLVTDKGDVACVGKSDQGQLGDEAAPVRNATQIFCGRNHACAITSSSSVYCWGSSQDGKLGAAAAAASSMVITPQRAVLPAGYSSIKHVAAGESHTCLVTAAEGHVLCAGSNRYGQLGTGAQSDDAAASFVRATVLSVGAAAVTVATGTWHTCALLSSSGVSCWGLVYYGGELGSELHVQAAFVPAGWATGVSFLSCAQQNTLVIHAADGSASAFGSNAAGVFATGDNRPYKQPVSVARGTRRNLLEIRGSGLTVCAVSQDTGAVQCAGDDFFGQLGNGEPRALSLALVDVDGLPIEATLAPSMAPTARPTDVNATTPGPTPMEEESTTGAPSTSPSAAPSSASSSGGSSTGTPSVVDDDSNSGGGGTTTPAPTVSFSSPTNGLVIILIVACFSIPVILHGRSRV